jgi:predicted nuclease of restriction endonuclease-like RecB superfamily
VRFAKLLPVLLTCEGWQFSAKFKTKRGNFYSLDLSPKNGLRSILDKPPMFDSGVEESFAQKFGEVREGWKLIREGAILHRHQKTFVPDFVFRHEDGREVLFEIVGFWTPNT